MKKKQNRETEDFSESVCPSLGPLAPKQHAYTAHPRVAGWRSGWRKEGEGHYRIETGKIYLGLSATTWRPLK